jgi:hypothetical protein
VADALSRRDLPDDCSATQASVACIAALSEFRTSIAKTLQSQIISGYDLDPFCTSLKATLPLRDDCIISDGLILIDGWLLIPAIG